MTSRIDLYTGADRPWALLPDALQGIVAARATFARADHDSRSAMLAALDHDEPDEGYEKVETSGRVAVVPLKGLITPNGGGLLAMLFGGSGLNAFRAQLEDAVASSDVDAIVLDVDSPGGSVELVPETAAFVREMAQEKPMVAAVNTLAASAAYWIASQAHEIVATPSGRAGSIGVYRQHDDVSGMDKQMGVKATLVSAGKHKTEGNAYEPLSAEARAEWQREVDYLYGLFTADVARGRGADQASVQSGYGEGRLFYAERAEQAGLVDRIGSLGDAIALAASGNTRRREAPASAARMTSEQITAAIEQANRAAARLRGETPPPTSSPRGGDEKPAMDRETRKRVAAALRA